MCCIHFNVFGKISLIQASPAIRKTHYRPLFVNWYLTFWQLWETGKNHNSPFQQFLRKLTRLQNFTPSIYLSGALGEVPLPLFTNHHSSCVLLRRVTHSFSMVWPLYFNNTCSQTPKMFLMMPKKGCLFHSYFKIKFDCSVLIIL